MKRLILFMSVIFCFHFCYGQTMAAKAPYLDNNPVIITPGKANISSNIIAVLFSGDGGWFSFEQSLADNLANSGIPTIGIDTKKYFWSRKSPETTASDVAKLFRYYGTELNKSQYLLIGYSQGAEIVPFVQTRLPEELAAST
jgi:type IV secretory pathway VirJ component